MIDLIKSGVEFNEIEHTYTLNGKELRGITAIIHEYICPDKYSAVPKRILNNACDRGHDIHSQVQMIVDGFGMAEPAPEVTALFDWATENKVFFAKSEYLVSDNDTFASCIDIVDDNGNLYDIKTWSQNDEEYLSWQLSIYAYLFELQNNRSAGKLYGVWLRDGKCKVFEVKRIESDIIKDLLYCAKNGLPFQNPFKAVLTHDFYSDDKLIKLAEIERQIAFLEVQKKELEAKDAELKSGLLELMQKHNVKKWENDILRITLKDESERTAIDSARLKTEQPDIYKQYSKTSKVKASVIIKIKDDNDN